MQPARLPCINTKIKHTFTYFLWWISLSLGACKAIRYGMDHTGKRVGDASEEKASKKVTIEDSYIPIGNASVANMIKHRFYADKTSYVAKLFKGDGTFYFFIRPRRFGKTLLLDTIDQIAQGNRNLFKHCEIAKKNREAWEKYPVIRLDFSKLPVDSANALTNSLIYIFRFHL